jgi:hypothetical protein
MSNYERQTEMKGNYGRGPTTGNASARKGKREIFAEGKAERADLADSIKKAYAMRAPTVYGKEETYIDPSLEGVESDVKPKKFKR